MKYFIQSFSLAGAFILLSAMPVQATRFDHPGGFGPATRWVNGFSLANEVPGVGDFNGDGRDDLVTFVRNAVAGPSAAHVYVALNSGLNLFANRAEWNAFFSIDDEIPMVGDFNGDGKDDVITLVPGTGKVWVAVSNGTAFINSSEWHSSFMLPNEVPLVGDFNGDGRDDIATCTRGTQADVYVALSNGTTFGTVTRWQDDFCSGTGVPKAGDVNGDGRADLVCFVRDSRTTVQAGDVEVALSNGTTAFSYGGIRFWHQNFAPTAAYEPLLADLNGDGSMDILAASSLGPVYGAVSTGANSFASGNGTETGNAFWQWHPALRVAGEEILAGHFGADVNDDLAVFTKGLRAAPNLGSVYVTHAGGHAVAEPDTRLADFGYGTKGAGDTLTVRPLLFIVSECAGSPLTRTLAQYEQLVFGPGHPSIVGQFAEISNGKLQFTKAGAFRLGPYVCPLPDATSAKLQLEDAANQDGVGTGFEFKNYDNNANGIVETHELALLGISSFYRIAGQTFSVDTVVFPGTAREVRVQLKWAFTGDAVPADWMSHELAHQAADMVDIYGSDCRGFQTALSSCNHNSNGMLLHMDPWHRIRLGWAKPLIYDIRHFPAGALSLPAQHIAERPIILYDSSRGTQEYHIIEHRSANISNGTITSANAALWGIPGNVFSSTAGYDRSLSDSNANNRGFFVWSVKTDAAHNVLDIPQGILPGANGTLNSTLSGDDVWWPGNGAATQIHCGPDGILQSARLSDDTVFQDALCLPTANPGDIPNRSVSTLNNTSGATAEALRLYSGADTGVKVRGNFINGNNGQYLEWGAAFRPWINSLTPAAEPIPGETFTIRGNLGARDRYQAWLVGADGTTSRPYLDSWDGQTAVYHLPGTHRGGKFRFMLFDDVDLKSASNAVEMTLPDPCAVWKNEHFTATEQANPLISGDTADPDGDGVPNLAEEVMMTNPRTPNKSPIGWHNDPHSDYFQASIRVNNDRNCYRIIGESSTDCIHWTEQHILTPPFGDQTSYTPAAFPLMILPKPEGPKAFFRVKFVRR